MPYAPGQTCCGSPFLGGTQRTGLSAAHGPKASVQEWGLALGSLHPEPPETSDWPGRQQEGFQHRGARGEGILSRR